MARACAAYAPKIARPLLLLSLLPSAPLHTHADTEIDWSTYMEHLNAIDKVRQRHGIHTKNLHLHSLPLLSHLSHPIPSTHLFFLPKGERDYTRIDGASGPLVYPAGHVWLHKGLRALTGGGDIGRGQVLFAGLYLLSQAVALGLTIAARAVPPAALPLLAASKRLHSIYVLRLFNDCWSATLVRESERESERERGGRREA